MHVFVAGIYLAVRSIGYAQDFSSLDFLSPRLICSASNLFCPVLSSSECQARKRSPARARLVGCLESAAQARFQAPGTFSIEMRPCVQSLCARSRDRFSLPCVFRFGLRSTVCAPISAVNFPTAKQSGFWSRAKGAHDSRFDFPLDVLRLSAEAVFVLSSRSCSWTALQTSGGGQWSVCFSLQTSSSRRLFFCSMSRVRLLFCSSCVLTDRSISRYCS
jgi:hypothetical protein